MFVCSDFNTHHSVLSTPTEVTKIILTGVAVISFIYIQQNIDTGQTNYKLVAANIIDRIGT